MNLSKKITGNDIALRTVSRKHLDFDIDNLGLSNSGVNSTGTIAYDEIVSSENTKIHAISFAADGLGYNADAVANKPATAVSINGTTMGNIIKLKYSGKIKIPGAVFELNKTVFLSTAGSSTPNLSTTPPTIDTGYIVQIIGTSGGSLTESTTDILFIDIDPPGIVG